jgi:hypothetical protein
MNHPRGTPTFGARSEPPSLISPVRPARRAFRHRMKDSALQHLLLDEQGRGREYDPADERD